MTVGMVFPGQGSQKIGMQADLAEKYPEITETYARASDVLEYDLWSLVQSGPAERLDQTTVTQPAMLTAGYAAWLVWLRAGGSMPDFLAGHSLGEYTALVCAEAFSFEDALHVVSKRSELMQEAVPAKVGAMAAIIGLDDSTVLRICEEASGIGVAEAVNFNSPGQVVIAGHRDAVLRAIGRAEDAGARRAILLHVSVPSHSSLMIGAGEALVSVLSAVKIRPPKIKVFNSTDAVVYSDETSIREHLAKQVHSPVHWVDTIKAMIEAGSTSLIECGPGRVLSGLIRRISREVPAGSIDSLAELQKALNAQ